MIEKTTESAIFCATRRGVLAGLMSSVAAATVLRPAIAQTNASMSVTAKKDKGVPFSFDTLSERMRALADEPHKVPPKLESFLDTLSYDDYRNIRFDPERERWSEPGVAFRAHAFHPGWLYDEAVELHEVVDGMAFPMDFSTDDFIYSNTLEGKVPDHAELPGVAGFRLHYPLNRADVLDELVSFVGASYFRALGAGNTYGLSARGLAVDTWLAGPEEFPRFSEFWLERPLPGSREAVICASLESPSLTGAYRFVIRPGEETVVDVTARLYFRETVEQLGVAPLTSMFLFAEHSDRKFDDFRPQVHDSDALMVERKDGDVVIRPLNNPPLMSSSFFSEPEMRRFGLIQRDRDYAAFEDAGAHYHDRPSVLIEPLNNWGEGDIRLIEVPTDLEIEDNIVAFWVPSENPKAGETREYSYRLWWGALEPDTTDGLAWIQSTKTGHGGPAGVEITNENLRKFVIDFKGGLLGAMPEDAVLEPVVTLSGGELQTVVLSPVEGTDIWRLVLDVDVGVEQLIEMMAHVAGYDRKLTETWMFQWSRLIT